MLSILVLGAVLAEGPPAAPGVLSPAEAAQRESVFLANPRPLVTEGDTGEGYFSPDGRKIIFQSIRDDYPFYQIYVKDLETGREQRVSTGAGRTTCAYFHPTRPRILFASSHLNPNLSAEESAERRRLEELRKNPPKRRSYSWVFDPHMEIFEADPDGGNLVRLTDAPGYDAEGAYSPDGTQIAFCSFRNGNGDVYVMNSDGSNVRQLTDAPGYDGGPFFSPDGRRIIFRGEARKRDYLQLFVIEADGTGERQLTNNQAVNWGPYWHPDGKHVLFSTSLHGHYNYELYLMNVDTGKMQRVTFMPGADVLPVFDRAGRRMMWTTRRGPDGKTAPRSQLWIADWVYRSGE